MTTGLILGIIVVILGLAFNFSNGFNDSANIIAIPIGTRALKPGKALIIAGIFEFIGTYFFGQGVAKTIGTGIIDPNLFVGNKYAVIILFSTLLTSTVWNVVCTILGMPISASHALIGGFIGSGIAIAGFESVQWNNVVKIFITLFLAPAAGLVSSYILTKIVYSLAVGASNKINSVFKFLEVVSSAFYAVSHGSNDGQKAIGIITFSLIVLGLYKPQHGNFAPQWVIIACAVCITLGIMFGGWSVIKTIGMNIYKIKHINGFVAQGSAALVIYIASMLGLPLSTTHVITTSVMGTGAAERMKGVRWSVGKNVFITWFITIPMTAIVAFILYYLIFNLVKILGL
ncbi:MAG: inorganic phosphate transporter [Endomicrobia bacterium]|nr:inorganic phosphate transporter [Endomicrobiia bacterium]MCX7941304.1 inorganic phosphate transporter [Endomicrobiia bacterium]MDW8055950.1 inorganic phosphate transporter [Elusimicrobiota bacterium]